jgi:hypothetical protein
MALELKVVEDDGVKKVDLPNTDGIKAILISETSVRLDGVVGDYRLIADYEKDSENDTWNKVWQRRKGTLVIGQEAYASKTPEYQAFELLMQE